MGDEVRKLMNPAPYLIKINQILYMQEKVWILGDCITTYSNLSEWWVCKVELVLFINVVKNICLAVFYAQILKKTRRTQEDNVTITNHLVSQISVMYDVPV